ncbi:MAG TPA: disulfide bond formation protein B [Nevskiaceae bacterium]|nr:disulfide bond formation protein B [Nevskiaceae bacterium]
MLSLSYRQLCSLGLLACVFAMAFALYLQHYRHLEPCNMCIFQRVAMMGAGVFFAGGAIFGPRGGMRWFWSGFATVAALIGVGLAARHVQIQHLPPDQVPACGGSLDYLFDVLPWKEVVENVLRGDTDCAKINAAWLGLSLPAWTMITFIGLALFAIATPLVSRKSA